MLLSGLHDSARRRRAAVLIPGRKPIRALLLLAALVSVVSAGRAGAAPRDVRVYPIPGSRLGTMHTEIAFRGVAPSQLGAVSVIGSRSGAHADS